METYNNICEALPLGVWILILLTGIIMLVLNIIEVTSKKKRTKFLDAFDKFYKSVVIFEKLDKKATIPTRAHDYDAGYDFYATEDVTIPAHGKMCVKSGIAWEPKNEGCYMQLKARSGLAFKHGIECTSAGVIDSGYRGEIACILHNTSAEDYVIKAGERCFQGIVLPLFVTNAFEGEVSRDTERGEGGFGSSGK